MKGIFISFAISVIFCVAFSANVPKGLVIPTSIKQSIANLVHAKGCDINICFIFNGSESLSEDEFENMKFFVQDIVNIISIGQDAEFAANQFSGTNYPISPLTGDKEAFFRALWDARVQRGGIPAIARSIVYCDSILSRRLGEANRIALITDGRNNRGPDPVERANNFRRRDPSGRVTVVGIGRNLDWRMLQKIAGNGNVLTVDEYINLAVIVTDFVIDVCAIEY